MNQESTNIQLILSKLINNPRCLIRALGSPNLFFTEIGVPKNCQKPLVDFINTDSHAFLSSSLFLARKRFLAIIESLHLFRNLKTLDCLDIYWNKYLFSFKFNDHAPKNPIYESIDFCQYIKNNENIDKIESIILNYEIERNKTILSYNTCPYSYYSFRVSLGEINKKNLNNYKIFFHPSSRIVKFFCNISNLISVCKAETDSTALSRIYSKTKEEIFFYKNYNNGKIVSIKFTQQLKDIFETFHLDKSLEYNFHLFHKNSNISFEEFMQLINNLINFGIGIILSIETEVKKNV